MPDFTLIDPLGVLAGADHAARIRALREAARAAGFAVAEWPSDADGRSHASAVAVPADGHGLRPGPPDTPGISAERGIAASSAGPSSWWSRLIGFLGIAGRRRGDAASRPGDRPMPVQGSAPGTASTSSSGGVPPWSETLAAAWEARPPVAGDLVFVAGVDRRVLRDVTELLASGVGGTADWHLRWIGGDGLPSKAELLEIQAVTDVGRLFHYAADGPTSQRLGRLGVTSFPALVDPVCPRFSRPLASSPSSTSSSDATAHERAEGIRLLLARFEFARIPALVNALRQGFQTCQGSQTTRTDGPPLSFRVETAPAWTMAERHELERLGCELVSPPTTTDARRAVLAEVDVVVDGGSEDPIRVVDRIWPPRTSEWLAAGLPLVMWAGDPAAALLADIHARWRREQAQSGQTSLSLGPTEDVVGRTYDSHDATAEPGRRLVEVVADVLDRREHFQRTAASVGPRFAAAHNPNQTVAQLVRRSCLARLRPSQAA